MSGPAKSPSLRNRLADWAGVELRSDQLAKSVTAAALIYLLDIIVVSSFAALVFSGPLAGDIASGISLFLVSTGTLILILALLSSYGGSIATAQDAPAVIMALATANAARVMTSATTSEPAFATVVVMIVVTTAGTGLAFVLLGFFRLGGLVRFLPYPVIGGFLAGSGWLLVAAAIDLMADGAPVPSLALFEPAVLVRWAPGLVLGFMMIVGVTRSGNALVLPGLAMLALIGFYATSLVAGVPVGELSAAGWLLGTGGPAGHWELPLTLERLGLVDWSMIGAQSGLLAMVVVVGIIGCLLNVSGLELVVRRDVDINRELLATGIANMAAGLGGGLVGFHALSLSSLNHAVTGGRRAPGILLGSAFVATALIGTALFAYLPKLVMGGLLSFMGLGLLLEWVYGAWFRFSRLEFLTIVLILTVITTIGVLEGIAVGLVVAVLLFLVSYSRISVVKHVLSGVTQRSRVTRSHRQQVLLETHGEQLYILLLQGFLFFGTANALVERVRARLNQHGALMPRAVVLDFAAVTGLDSTALLSFSKLLQIAEAERIVIVLAGLSPTLHGQIVGGTLSEDPSQLRIFPDLDHALEWCENALLADVDSAPDDARDIEDLLAEVAPELGTIRNLLGHLELVTVATGEYLIHQDEEPEHLFIIASGQVTAQLETPGQAPMRLETMRAGNVVGEIGFYLGTRRTAAVVAVEPCHAFRLSRRKLRELEQADPAAASTLHRLIVHLLSARVIHLISAVNALRR